MAKQENAPHKTLLEEQDILELRECIERINSGAEALFRAEDRVPIIMAIASLADSLEQSRGLIEKLFDELPKLPGELSDAAIIGAREFQRNFRATLTAVQEGRRFLVQKDKKPQALLQPHRASTEGESINASICQRNPSHYCNRALAGESFILSGEGVEMVPPPNSAFVEYSDNLKKLERRLKRRK